MIYKNESVGRYFVLMGITKKMCEDGKTPEEIALKIEHPIEEVLECVKLINDNDILRTKQNK